MEVDIHWLSSLIPCTSRQYPLPSLILPLLQCACSSITYRDLGYYHGVERAQQPRLNHLTLQPAPAVVLLVDVEEALEFPYC